jgi:1-acyl-sn-glycerol-3-phosphate acyltransferase
VNPPPRWIRRVLLAPAVLALVLGLIVTAPGWLLLTLVAAPLTAGRLRPTRVAWMAFVYLLAEAVLLIGVFALWLGSGFGWRVGRPRFRRAHYVLCARALAWLYRQARWVLRVSVRIEGEDPAAIPVGRPLLVLCRHAGPGDSFLLVHALLNWYEREPRIVLKAMLQWDPAIDVLLNRLPTTFIAPGLRGGGVEREIGVLATGLDENDALVIFPEGGNFTPNRWERGIQRLRHLGLHRMAGRAERMRNVLPPHPGGVLAALAAAPEADIVLVGHTGVDHLRSVGDVWRELPMDKNIAMHWWLEPAANIPAGDQARIEWLYSWWARIDAWVEENRVIRAA